MDSPRAPGGGSGGSFLNDLLSTSYTVQAPGTGDMRHGTEGWRCLETSFKARLLTHQTMTRSEVSILCDLAFSTHYFSSHPVSASKWGRAW